MGFFFRSIFQLLIWMFGKQLQKLFWLLFITLPLFLVKQLFTKAILPWWLLIVVVALAGFFW